MSDEQAQPARDPLPADFICPACGYDLSGAVHWICSECGHEVLEDDVELRERRMVYLALNPLGGMSRLALLMLACAISGSVLGMPLWPTILMLGIFFGLTLVSCIIVIAEAPRFQKRLALAAWVRFITVGHIGTLCIFIVMAPSSTGYSLPGVLDLLVPVLLISAPPALFAVYAQRLWRREAHLSGLRPEFLEHWPGPWLVILALLFTFMMAVMVPVGAVLMEIFPP